MTVRSGSLPAVRVTRYITPLREGGSLPGLVEAEDLGVYVCKFRGAGQGLRVLVAEVIVAELARRIGVSTPRLVVLDLDADIARYESDEEVQDLLRASLGSNLGIDFLPGSFGYDGHDPAAASSGGSGGRGVREEAERIVWLDALTANVDRSWRNPNLLVWHDDLWAIDHGASLYFHHAWPGGLTDPSRFAAQPWKVEDHVLRPLVGDLRPVDEQLRGLLDDQVLVEVLEAVPDEWLESVPGAADPDALRAAYVAFLSARLASRSWLPDPADLSRGE